MYSKFESLTEEKRKRIIDVCIEEFSLNGYKNASTNSIVKNAEISKGILFHYFGNKKRLYLYVLNYVVELLTKVIYGRMDNLSTDFFERVMQIGIIKMQAAHEYPSEYKFVIDAVAHTDEELEQEVQAVYGKMLSQGMPILFKDIDTSNFRKDMNKEKALEVIMFIVEGISNKYSRAFRNKSTDEIMSNMEDLIKEYYEYVEILKKGIFA